MQRLTYVVFISLAQCRGGKDRTSHHARSLVYSRFQTNDRDLWSGNETLCAHAYKIRKWRPKQRTAASECCEWLLLTRVNLKLWRRWVVGKLSAVMSIRFVLKSKWILEPFSSYHNLQSGRNKERKKERRIRKMALLLSHTFEFSCLPHGFWPLTWVLLITKALKEEAWALK